MLGNVANARDHQLPGDPGVRRTAVREAGSGSRGCERRREVAFLIRDRVPFEDQRRVEDAVVLPGRVLRMLDHVGEAGGHGRGRNERGRGGELALVEQRPCLAHGGEADPGEARRELGCADRGAGAAGVERGGRRERRVEARDGRVEQLRRRKRRTVGQLPVGVDVAHRYARAPGLSQEDVGVPCQRDDLRESCLLGRIW